MESDASPYSIHIPGFDEQNGPIEMRAGDTLFIVGANGAGKSGLMHHINKQYKDKALWIRATRQTLFGTRFSMLLPNQIRDTEGYIQKAGIRPNARVIDEHAGEKPNIIMTKLMYATQKQNTEVARLSRQGGDTNAYWEKNKPPLDVLNQILDNVKLPIISEEVSYDEKMRVHKNHSGEYDIELLSDGERGAMLIATEIITAPLGTIILIDEPERHLHRSVISPLLQKLFSERSDCCFVISTHDITLPTDNPKDKTLLVRGCEYNGGVPNKWDIDYVEHGDEIDEQTTIDILGSRRKLLFVEGEKSSLDKQLYSAVLPNISIIPKHGFKEVEQAVKSIRDSGKYHWLEVYGLIDKDERTLENIKQLEEARIYSLPVRSVESLYYSQKC